MACVNIANLLLARASARGREMAIRASIGAGRARLLRQLLTESLLLSLAGGGLGLLVAWGGVRGLVALAPPATPLIGRTAMDGATLAAALALSVVAWTLFGLFPAWSASAAAPGAALETSSRSTPSRAAGRLRHTLVVAQVAMAAVLVISCGLLLRGFWRLRQVDLGYEPRSVITLRVKLPETRYPWPKFPFREWPAVAAFCGRLKAAVREIPGVETVSLAMAGPARLSWTTRVMIEGRPAPPEGEQDEAQFRTADPDYLRAAGARLLRGRFFHESDDERHPLVAVINDAFRKRHFAGEEPLGRRILVFGTPRLVVGIVGDMRYAGPATPPEPAMYFPLRQTPFPDLTLIVRSHTDPASLAAPLRRAVFAADPNVAAFDVTTLSAALRIATARERFILWLLTGFAAVALALAAVGIYGVVAYSIGRRRPEIALRVALGARSRHLFAQLAGGTLLRALGGVCGGVILTSFAARLLQPLVFETSTHDVATYLAVGSLLLAVAFAGAAIPAFRAARSNPAATLRQE
jgi:predicted permease